MDCTAVQRAAPYLEIRDVSVAFAGNRVLDRINLDIQKGEFVALLGASGCGKTTLLRSVAGFQTVHSGAIRVEGRDITQAGPEARGMAMVFQSYALWPHMTVRQNVEYGLKLRRAPAAERAARFDEIEALLSLQGLAARKPSELSGGQRQRVALGRALAIRPGILLLDEPLSNLDARIRLQLREDIRTLQQRIGITAIHVTHDREEAMVMADRVAVLNAGRIEQVGTPVELYARPASAFVAAFMGAENSLPLEAEAGSLQGPEGIGRFTAHCPAGPLEARFRAEAAQIYTFAQAPAAMPGMLSATGRVSGASYLGGSWQISLTLPEGQRLTARAGDRMETGTPAVLQVPADKLFLFPTTPLSGRQAIRLPARETTLA